MRERDERRHHCGDDTDRYDHGQRRSHAVDRAGRKERIDARHQKHAGRDHGGGVDKRAHRRRAFHRVRQPDMERELSRLADCAAENQQRDERGAGAEQKEPGVFEATMAIVVKEQRAAAAVEPENAEEKSDIADARGDERFFCGGGGARFVYPESNEEVGREPDQFPTDE